MELAMRYVAFFLGAVAFIVSCSHARVVRDAEVYRVEIDQYDRWAVRQAALLRDFVSSECTCTAGRFEAARCSEAADWLLTVEARAAWHRQMALFNAGLVENRPAERPPVIPATACPLPPTVDEEDER